MRSEEKTIVGTDGVSVTVFEKRLSTRESAEPEAAARLRGEALLLAALTASERARGVTPRLVEAGEDERGPWLRTVKLPFPTLAQRLDAANGNQLDSAWIERAVRASFASLAELHEAADASGPLFIVHADVSPANVAIDDDGSRAVMLDLDLAAWRGAGPRDGAFRGTIGYCAPEVARGEPPTAASDLFSLAATLLHAITGAPPRSGPSFAALLGAAAERPLLDDLGVASVELAARGPGHAALVRCLAHLPGERPASARDVLALL
ncbi:MAG: serine/threonine protein kinase [Labilithrix sp.]|nr:serine/threonine protein kinase [Labilithrix sp.]